MKTSAFIIFILFSAFTAAHSQDVVATTARGQRVILHANGTWSKADDVPLLNGGEFSTPAASKSVLKGKEVSYRIAYNPGKWKIQKEAANADSEYEFAHSAGDAYAIIIAEKVVLQPDVLRHAALENAREASPDAVIEHEDERTVNGLTVRCLKITGTVEGVPVYYYNYYYTGQEGAVQLITFTSEGSFEEYEEDFADFLNGFHFAQ